MSQSTVSVRGVVYDTHSGMPLRKERGVGSTAAGAARSVHVQPQKSRTLSRKYIQKTKKTPEPRPVTEAVAISVHKKPTTPALRPQQHPKIKRFATPTPKKPAHPTTVISDIAATPHRLTQIAQQRAVAPAPRSVKPSHILKKEAIEKATAAMPSHRAKTVKRRPAHRVHRLAGMASGALGLLLLGAYFTYLNMPALSTRIAAAQAGINAKYPAYHPSGYRLSGPVTFQQGNVSMKFASNASPTSYTVEQTKSGWDSSALLESYILPKVGNDYETSSVNGLTVYTYGRNAAWINGGILYTISGDAPLSNQQIERIATSM